MWGQQTVKVDWTKVSPLNGVPIGPAAIARDRKSIGRTAIEYCRIMIGEIKRPPMARSVTRSFLSAGQIATILYTL